MRPGTSRHTFLLAAAAALLVLALGSAVWWLSAWRAEARRVEFVVPPGTAARLAAGEEPAILPQTITLTLGLRDTLVIRNEDTQSVQIGPFKIEPGQQFVQRYYNPGTYDLVCSIHESEQLRVIVRR
jgi:hypothetical protein